MLDWNLALAANKGVPNLTQRRERFESGDFPVTNTVLSRFGTWSEALEAAGLEVRVGGRPSWWPDETAEAA